jgi:hypothetical protein
MTEDAVNHDKEFLELLEYLCELHLAARKNKVLPAEKLIKIRGHVEHCCHIEENRHDQSLLYLAIALWNACMANWASNTPAGEENIAIPDLEVKNVWQKRKQLTPSTEIPEPPAKPFRTSAEDRRFLKRIKIDTTEPDDEYDQGDDDPA